MCSRLSCVNSLWGCFKLLERNVSSRVMKDNNYTHLISSWWSGWILKTLHRGDQCPTDKEHTHSHTQIKVYISLEVTFTHTKTQAHTLHTYIAIMSIMTEQLLTEADDSWNSSAEKWSTKQWFYYFKTPSVLAWLLSDIPIKTEQNIYLFMFLSLS